MIGTVTTAPYAFTWDSTQAADGEAALLAYAYDEAGNRGQSASTMVVVANTGNAGPDTVPPQVIISSPADGAHVSGHQTLSATATDNVQVAEVRLYLDGVLKCAGAPGASCGWDAGKAGSHRVTALATDAAGNTARASVTVTVEGAPR